MKAVTVIIMLVIVFVAVFVISEGSRRRDKESYTSIIKESNKRERVLRLQVDSLKSVSLKLKKEYNDLKQSYTENKNKLSEINKKYEKIRNSKPVPYTDKQIDSILNRYYPRP